MPHKQIELIEFVPKHGPSCRCVEATKKWKDAVINSEAPESDIQLLVHLREGIWPEQAGNERRIPVFQITNTYEKSPDYGATVIVATDSLSYMFGRVLIWPSVLDQFKRTTSAQLGVMILRGRVSSGQLYKIEAEHIKHFFK